MQHQALAMAAPTPASQNTTVQIPTTDAPPKQVAQAMERLSQAARLIADVRIGADRLLEALFVAAQPHQSNKPVHLFQSEDASMRQHLQDLRSIGKQLEETGVLTESLRSRSKSWGLHMPLVCPDGAVVAYAWKRQLAGQAGASAVDRTRLALKAFTDQKRRFFPHLDEDLCSQNAEPSAKRQCNVQVQTTSHQEEHSDCKTLSDVLARLGKEVPNLKISTYERLDWIKRASSLPASSNDSSSEALKDHGFPSSTSRMKPSSLTVASVDKVAVVELFFPNIFRAVVSLHPAGSIDPDAVAFFSPDEGGRYLHARGVSVSHVFRHVTEHAAAALQYFIGVEAETALYSLLHWISGYQNLFTKPCSKCGRLLAMDRQLALFLPPVYRPYQKLSALNGPNSNRGFHIGCFSEEI